MSKIWIDINYWETVPQRSISKHVNRKTQLSWLGRLQMTIHERQLWEKLLGEVGTLFVMGVETCAKNVGSNNHQWVFFYNQQGSCMIEAEL